MLYKPRAMMYYFMYHMVNKLTVKSYRYDEKCVVCITSPVFQTELPSLKFYANSELSLFQNMLETNVFNA